MPRRLLFALFVLPVLLVTSRGGAAPSALQPSDAARDDMLAMASQVLARAVSVAAFRSVLLTRFELADQDGGGVVGASDRALRARISGARARLRLVGRWLAHDLNGDGRVTRAELAQGLTPEMLRALRKAAGRMDPDPALAARMLAQMVEAAGAPDADGDGAATFEEMLAEAKRLQIAGRPERGADGRLLPASFDLDGDGAVSLAEYKATADAALGRLDRDGDLFISDAEIAASAPERARAVERMRARRAE